MIGVCSLLTSIDTSSILTRRRGCRYPNYIHVILLPSQSLTPYPSGCGGSSGVPCGGQPVAPCGGYDYPCAQPTPVIPAVTVTATVTSVVTVAAPAAAPVTVTEYEYAYTRK